MFHHLEFPDDLCFYTVESVLLRFKYLRLLLGSEVNFTGHHRDCRQALCSATGESTTRGPHVTTVVVSYMRRSRPDTFAESDTDEPRKQVSKVLPLLRTTGTIRAELTQFCEFLSATVSDSAEDLAETGSQNLKLRHVLKALRAGGIGNGNGTWQVEL